MKKRGKNKKKLIESDDGIKYTVCGEWFPLFWDYHPDPYGKEDETPLDTEMRLFCACTRWAFNRLQEGRSREELKREGQKLFGINSRFCDDAVLKAKAVIESQKELLALEIEETETKLARARKKLGWAEKDLDKAVEANDLVKIEKAKHAVHGCKARVKKLKTKLDELKTHQSNGTIPAVVFGGRSLWKGICKGRVSKEEWRQARQNRLFARGDETKGGNPNIKISYRNGEFALSVTVSHLSEQIGTDSRGRPVMTRAPRVEGKLWLPEKHRLKVWELLLSGAPYTVELIRGGDGRYRVHISFAITAPEPVTNPSRGYLGMDTNPDGIALANVDYFGQPEPWPEGFTVPHPKALHKFAGEFQVTVHPNGFLYIKVSELAYSRGYRRTYLIGVLAKVVVDIAKALGKPIALEDLYFGKDRLDTNRKFNRMAVNFPFRKIIEAVMGRAFKEGIGVKPVRPAHTSTIGYYKYMERYGVIIHHAAALTIARRAIDFRDRITNELKQKILAVKEKLIRKVGSLPGEGKGMTRKVKRLFKRLDKKIPVYNGLDRYKQESFYSVWHDLKELVLLSR
ncbi:IS200/IS605 family accessory protein TnpB-related protein [Desulfofundulus thermosubterraneus]|uniref:Transposase, IS605 OrfB family, central region n=1 Tax=Desulfofundulus thermosubterraneus DSM 16057 TaxID=1121432 RepID=A0A1M6CF50_9FIRM|nr:IS200/IS605 family accessory protein TnpB-related protein [Desulfofundulus thermosubterraneus]SHI59543.1 transposase, IS605 OrfB family, central region [Desulfofundulus thermosubterraneus DSM 16057]